MDSIYIIFICILFALAISDLIVGVSNDAVNFLNSAIGSKVASFRTIMVVAALGILVGATFSSGMMEVARKGIFHPEHFFFSEIMVIFLAVMLTDIILLDLYNTFGLPTSTTVSIVFELLGAAVAVSVIKITSNPDSLQLYEYINTSKALAIITGILLSVFIAFSVGALVQYIARLFFSFNYEKNLKYFGSVWGGIAITAITYFMLIKGAKGASFMSDDTKAWIMDNALMIMSVSFISWTVLLQLLHRIVKLNILKLIVLFGTFALAMAFAGNDLVNFIGVPLAGFESFKAFIAEPGAVDNQFLMGSLSGEIKTDTYILIIAGLIMVATLWLSRKAKSVVQTSINLSRQHEGDERFGSALFARSIVRSSRNIGKIIQLIIPTIILNKIGKQFDQTHYNNTVAKNPDAPAFDLVRASVTLVVASVLIAFATSLKLPLSTTYVTFMVAMGTSLSDGAWGQESAVYRITGVLLIIGGWFFTALSAFAGAFVIAYIIHSGGIIAIGALLIIAVLLFLRMSKIHKKREDKNEKAAEIAEEDDELQYSKVLENCTISITDILTSVSDVYEKSLLGITTENRKLLGEAVKEVIDLNKETKHLKDNIYKTVLKLQEDSVETGHYYVQVLDYLRETTHCLTYIAKPGFDHVDNSHKGFIKDQLNDIENIKNSVINIIHHIIQIIINQRFSELSMVLNKQYSILEEIHASSKKQIKRIKEGETGTKNSLLYLNILHETKNLLLYAINLLKAQRDFVEYENNNI